MPASRTTAVEGVPPDLVLMHDGGMLRGTIVESAPGQHVIVQLMTGEVQTIPWEDVRFAGRAEEAPIARAPGPMESAARPGVRLRFVADRRMTLHRSDASSRMSASMGLMRIDGHSEFYERACTAPCELWTEPGVHQFALAVGEGRPQHTRALDITEPGTLHGIYVDNLGLRVAGGITFASTFLTGGALVAFAFLGGGGFEALISGSILAGLGLLIGIPLMAAGDGVVLRFE